MVSRPQHIKKSHETTFVPPPDLLAAEESVISSLLVDNEQLFEIDLLPEEFYKPDCQLIYSAITGLIGEGTAADLVTVANRLRGQVAASRLSYLIDSVPLSLNISAHAEIIRDGARRRALVAKANKAMTQCSEGISVEEILADLQSFESEYTSNRDVSLSAITTRAIESLEKKHHADGPPGLPTGFAEFDRTLGGLHPTDLHILAARPSMGKTAMALNIARNLGHHNYPGLIFSLEMSEEQLCNRLISDVGNVNSQIFRHGKVPDDRTWKDITQAAATISEMPIYIIDTPGLTLPQIQAISRKFKMVHGIRWIIVDYLQQMGDWDPESQKATGSICRGLKGIAKVHDLPLIALCQLNRNLEIRKDKVPIMSDLRDSGSLEQDADVVIFPFRPYVYDRKASPIAASLIAAKNRNGPVEVFDLSWSKEHTRYYDPPLWRPIFMTEKLKRPDALKYLQDNGWEVAKTKFYQDIKKGLLSLQDDKTVREQDLINYARATLKRKAGVDVGEHLVQDQSEKTREEILKIRVQRQNSQFDLDVKKGKYLPRADFAREMAARGRVFDTYLRHHLRSSAGKWLAMVGGDAKKLDTFIEALDKGLNEALNRFATMDQFQVMILGDEADE